MRGSETWSLSSKEKRSVQELENKVPINGASLNPGKIKWLQNSENVITESLIR
jgi:hypothetical protein